MGHLAIFKVIKRTQNYDFEHCIKNFCLRNISPLNAFIKFVQ